MLPDLRVVTIAVISTFLFAVSVGFYTSSRLVNERKPRPDSLAAIEDHPLNRIALNWPEPVQPQSNSLDLDFAVSAKVLRNPVRDVSDDQVAAPAPEPKVAAAPASCDSERAPPKRPVAEAPKIEAPDGSSKPEMPKPEVAQTRNSERSSTVTAPPAPAAPQAKPDEEVPTASIIEAPRVNLNPPGDGAKQAPEPAAEPPASEYRQPSRPGCSRRPSLKPAYRRLFRRSSQPARNRRRRRPRRRRPRRRQRLRPGRARASSPRRRQRIPSSRSSALPR